MKRFLVIFLLINMFIVCLLGCSNKQEKNDKLNVVCTVFPQYDFVREIAGDSVNLKMLVPLGVESHDFKLENLTVADLNMVNSADLFIYIGGESDGDWVNELKNTVSNKNIRWIALTDIVDLLPEATSNGMVAEELLDHEHHHDTFDEHVWTSPKRVKQIVGKLTEVLCELDTNNSEKYSKACENFSIKLLELDEKMTKLVSDAKIKTLIFADRFSFRYLCADYGLDFIAAFNGCSANTDPSVVQISSLCESVIKTKIKAIFYMENSKPEYARQIADLTATKANMLHSCHTVSKEDYNLGATYISLMNENLEKIAEAIQ